MGVSWLRGGRGAGGAEPVTSDGFALAARPLGIDRKSVGRVGGCDRATLRPFLELLPLQSAPYAPTPCLTHTQHKHSRALTGRLTRGIRFVVRACPGREGAAGISTPLQVRGVGIVSHVPPGVLHQGERDAGEVLRAVVRRFGGRHEVSLRGRGAIQGWHRVDRSGQTREAGRESRQSRNGEHRCLQGSRF